MSASEYLEKMLCDCGEFARTAEWWIELLRWFRPSSARDRERAFASEESRREHVRARDAELDRLLPGGAEHPSSWALLYLMDGIGLIEHGANARVGWLTKDGELVLAALEQRKNRPS